MVATATAIATKKHLFSWFYVETESIQFVWMKTLKFKSFLTLQVIYFEIFRVQRSSDMLKIKLVKIKLKLNSNRNRMQQNEGNAN